MPMATSTILAVLESFSLRASFTCFFVGSDASGASRLTLGFLLPTAIVPSSDPSLEVAALRATISFTDSFIIPHG